MLEEFYLVRGGRGGNKLGERDCERIWYLIYFMEIFNFDMDSEGAVGRH